MDCQALEAEDLLRQFWQLANTQQWTAMGQLLDPGLRYEVPQTREFITGREGFVDFFATWPQPWRVEVERCIAQGDQLAVQMSFHDDSGSPMTCVGFYELAGGRIRRIVEYWPVNYEPPARHSAHVQRLP
ncbi:putative SnoaL-like aldol condensation-catalyzing enzyme [Inhella inkyongensis]|uniref:Putative SnoaL-like aldol condensation-catalyzing enzyme n=1 Tax=Inhella inkyongensis TaxID=392593 RepID=A0A840S2J9_9BURK|nr:nuclear transport factor 2 family protein [Inhella inkyongensis]MBB5202769.1 putative SnoaL-like aldol condensation-catalyzing enzyme [Inhella inkyongensis]